MIDTVGVRRMNHVFDDIYLERNRQERLKSLGKFPFTCADVELGDISAGLILGEEYGEVCRAVLNASHLAHDQYETDLRAELVQVAAVTVAWIEKLDKRAEQKVGMTL